MTRGAPGRLPQRRSAGRPPEPGDAGAVTIEAALALCALTVFLVAVLGTLTAVAQSMRCADAARELARLAARGAPEQGRVVAAALAPRGASMELTEDHGTVTATVRVRLVGGLAIGIGGRAVAALEPGVSKP